MQNTSTIHGAMRMSADKSAIADAMAAPLHPSYRPDIDGLRAIAVLPVLVYHAFPRWMPSGFVGVDIFFVISGFLISTVIMGNLEEARFSYADFYSRRIRRIFPALLAMLIAVLAFGWVSLFPVEFKALGKHVLGGAAFISNIFLWNESGYFDKIAESKPLLHLWSLGIEEQYYIFWPLILSMAWRAKRRLPLVILLIGSASFVWSLFEIGVDPVGAFYSPAARIWELMLGSALAFLFTVGIGQRRALDGAMPMISSVSGSLLLLAGFLLIREGKSFPGWWALLPTLGSMLLIAGGPASWVNHRLLSNRWMVFVGKISFPLYIWHWPLLSFAQILYAGSPPPAVKILLLMTTFVLAWLTYRFIERPIRYGQGLSSATMPLAATAVAIASIGVFIYWENGITSRSIVAYNPALATETPYAANPPYPCPGMANDVISKSKLCTIYPAATPVKTIVLWGDSSTGAWLPVFLDIGKERSYSIVNLSHPSCPPILDARKTTFDYRESREYCQDGQMQRLAIQEIERLHPDLIVLIAAWNSYSERTNKEFITDRPGEAADAASTKRTLQTRVPETLEALTGISRTVVFKSWPIMPIARNMKIARALAIPGIEAAYTTNFEGPTVPVGEFVEDSRNINAIFDRQRNPRLSFYDPSRKICSSGTCESHDDRINYYSDTYHVSVAGALSFRSDIEALLEP